MKVVQELVAYFDRRGKLNAAQIRSLLDSGYLAADAPVNMLDMAEPIGATYYFRVVGKSEGPLWGTDVYTGDSALAVAAVHAGQVKVDETAIVKVKVLAPPSAFSGSVRHGVTSHDFGRFGSAYSLAGI